MHALTPAQLVGMLRCDVSSCCGAVAGYSKRTRGSDACERGCWGTGMVADLSSEKCLPWSLPGAAHRGCAAALLTGMLQLMGGRELLGLSRGLMNPSCSLRHGWVADNGTTSWLGWRLHVMLRCCCLCVLVFCMRAPGPGAQCGR